MENLILNTTEANPEEEKTLTFFGKKVTLNSFAVYWKPKAEMLSEEIGKTMHSTLVVLRSIYR